MCLLYYSSVLWQILVFVLICLFLSIIWKLIKLNFYFNLICTIPTLDLLYLLNICLIASVLHILNVHFVSSSSSAWSIFPCSIRQKDPCSMFLFFCMIHAPTFHSSERSRFHVSIPQHDPCSMFPFICMIHNQCFYSSAWSMFHVSIHLQC